MIESAAAQPAAAQPAVPLAPARPLATDLDAPAELLVPRHPRTEADQDRLEATALFAAARTAEQQQEFPKALQLYERALRRDAGASPIQRAIIVLAFNLDRRAEAARYAQRFESPHADDAVLLRRLGLELAEEGNWESALKLYERVAAVQPVEKSATSVLWWMEMGRLYYLTRQFASAANEFDDILAALADPEKFGLNETLQKAIVGKGDLTYQLFGECYLDAGRTAEARRAFEKANEYGADASQLAYNLARVEAAEKHYAVALEKLEAFFANKTGGQGTGPFTLLSELLTELDRSAELIPRLEALHATDKGDVPLAYSLAEAYLKAGRTADAEAAYRQLCDAARKRPPVEAYQSLIRLLHAGQRWGDLLDLLGQAVGRTGALDSLGAPVKELLADPAAMTALLAAAAIRRDAVPAPDYGAALAAALLAVEQKHFDAADDYFALALAADADRAAELLLTWGIELLSAGEYVAAARVFQRGIDEQVLPAENASFHYYLSGALAMSDQTEAALAAARRAADLQKDSARFQSRIGWIYHRAKQYDQSQAAYAELVKRFESQHDSAEIREVLRNARLALSSLGVSQGNIPAAEEWLEQVLDEFPGDVGAMNDLGYLWADQNHHVARALGMIEQAVAAEPENMAYRDSLGWALFRLGRSREAVDELRKAAEVSEPDGVVLDHFGDALLANGDTPAAVAAWQRAVEAFGKDQETAKCRQTQTKIDKAANR